MKYIIVITESQKFYGMFNSANAAAKWALKNFTNLTTWHIAIVRII